MSKGTILLYPHGLNINDLSGLYPTYQNALNDILQGAGDLSQQKIKKGSIASFINELHDIAKPLKMDTSIGGNEVINPYPCGNEDDDIIFPLTAVDKQCTRGLGYVYKDVIQDNQKVLWLSCGIPRFNDLEGFYGFTGGIEDQSQYAKSINEGGDTKNFSFFGQGLNLFGRFVGDTVKTAGKLVINLPFLAPRFMNWVEGKAGGNDEITKYYDFEPAMIQYYKLVNSIIGELAVGMGLYTSGTTGTSTADVAAEVLGSGTAAKKVESGTDGPEQSPDKGSVPEVLKNGPDIFTIIDKRRRFADNTAAVRNMDQSDDLAATCFNFAVSGIEAAQGADQFIGFRIEKSTDTYESISNSTGESQISSILNNTSQEIRASMFSFMGASFGGPDSFVSKTTQTVKDLGENAMNFISAAIGRPNFTGTATTLFTGNGYFDIPEVWKSSSFTKSYTFSTELESRLGDPISIYQNIYIPLACLLAAATPRAVGKNMYTSPFVLQAYVQGMFAIPLGIIDSITIKRGSSDYGWNKQGLPTTISVSFTIKDLSPALFLSLYGEGFLNIFSSNSSMHEYLATLSGLGLAERKRYGKQIMKKWNAALALHRTTTFNPIYWATSWGNNRFVRMVGSLASTKYPEN